MNALSARQGGGQTYLRNLFAHVPARGDLRITVHALPGLDLPPHPQVRVAVARWPAANPICRTLWERFVLPRLLRHEQVDVLFCPGGVIATRPPLGCRTVTMFRNILPFDPPMVRRLPWGWVRLRTMILRRVMLRSMARADLTIFISGHARRVIESIMRVPGAVTIPHGIGPAFRTYGQLLERPPAAPAGDYLLYVSRFEHYKHHEELVRAYALLPDELRRRHPLLLLGEAHLPDGVRVARLVRELGLNEHVHMPGAVPYAALPAYYQHASAIVFASSCENCPNVLLEALGSGRPILCSNVMPMPEFGSSGLIYFSPTDPEGIAQALRTALLDPARAAASAAAALERSRDFDWGRSAGETWTYITELANRRASAAGG